MKKIVFIFLSLAFVLSFAGCQSEMEFNGNDMQDSHRKTPYEIALSRLPQARSMIRNLNTRSGDAAVTSSYPLTLSDSTASNLGLGGNMEVTDSLAPGTGAEPGDVEIPPVVYAYVFNFGDEEGFAVVSALEVLPGVLAFSDNGEFNPAPREDKGHDEETGAITEPGYLATHTQMYATVLNMLERSAEYLLKTLKYNNMASPGDGGSGGYAGARYDTIWDKNFTEPRFIGPYNGLCKVNWHGGEPFLSQLNKILRGGKVISSTVVAMAQYLSVTRFPTFDDYEGENSWERLTRVPDAKDLDDTSQSDIAYLYALLIGKDYINSNLYDPAVMLEILNLKKAFRKLGYDVSNMKQYERINNDVITEIEQGYPVLTVTGYKGVSHLVLVDGAYTAKLGYTLVPRYPNYSQHRGYHRYTFLKYNWGDIDKNIIGYFLSNALDSRSENFNPETLLSADMFPGLSVYYGARKP